jgi:sugar transferase EpsL
VIALMLKRIVDIVGASAGLFFLSPVLIFVYVVIRSKMGVPVLFKQRRPGKYGVPFNIYKFRTMIDAEDKYGNVLPDEVRLTAFGKFLRTTSLDELPELINVIRGDMSLVGPRPLLMQYLNRYTPKQARRNEVKPGLSGWAQVNGRNAISWEEKFDYDVWYVDHHNMLLDFKIIGLTLKKVFIREGINATGEATMPEFFGTEKERI